MATVTARTCPSCGARVGERDQFCRACGKPVPQARYCTACGVELPAGVRFCPACGVAVEPVAPAPVVPAPVAPLAARPSRPRITRRPAAAATPAERRGRRWPYALVAVVVVVGLLVGALVVGERNGGGGGTPTPAVDETGYAPKTLVPGTTTPESASLTTTPGQPATLSLSDGTRIDLPALDGIAEIALERQSNALTLDGSGQQPTGSMRVLTITAASFPEDVVPVLTIPGREAGEIIALNAARVGDLLIDGEVIHDAVRFLPVTRDEAGNLVVSDALMPLAAPVGGVVSDLPPGGLASTGPVALQADPQTRQVKVVASTYQELPNWKNEPRLVRMVPDAYATLSYRVPLDSPSLDPAAQAAELKKPIKNVVVFVHGHNEAERRGNEQHETVAPWEFNYKHDVWTFMYEAFALPPPGQPGDVLPPYNGCTAFYEFIYPTYRPIFSSSHGVTPLGQSFAASLRNDPQIRKMVEAKQPFNLYIVAHSMGGLVARAGVNVLDPANAFDKELLGDWKRLITWGTPHRGSAVVTLRYLLDAGIKYTYDPMGFGVGFFSIPLDTLHRWRSYKAVVESVAVDTPGERDLRWDDDTSLHLSQAGWDLPDGSGMGTIFSVDLNWFNAHDRYRYSPMYAAIFGVTQKTVPEVNLDNLPDDLLRFVLDFNTRSYVAKGAYLTYHLYQSADRMTLDGVEFSVRQSDGAVPIPSMAGDGVVSSQNAFYIGEMDHEEYFGAPRVTELGNVPDRPDLGRKMAYYTLQLMNYTAIVDPGALDRTPKTSHLFVPDCRCQEVLLDAPVDGQQVPADAGTLAVSGKVNWPGVDPDNSRTNPAWLVGWTESLQVLVDGQPVNDSSSRMALQPDLTFATAVDISSLPGGVHDLSVRATFRDGSELMSAPVRVTVGETTVGQNCWADQPHEMDMCLIGYMGSGATEPLIQWAFVQADMSAIFFQLTYQRGDGLWDIWSFSVPYDGSGSFQSGEYSGTVTPSGVTLTITRDDGSQQVIVFDQ